MGPHRRRLFGGGAILDYRDGSIVATGQNGQNDAGGEKGTRQNAGRTGQQIGCRPAADQPAHAAARTRTAEPAETAFGALDQHDADQRQRQEQVYDEDDSLHCSFKPRVLGWGRS